MIIGTGIDIVEVARIGKAARNARFYARVFSPAEIELLEACRYNIQTVAGRFASKEAVLKALGRGLCDVPLTSIEVLRTEAGRPVVSLRGAARARAQALGVLSIHISISHDGGFAIAQAVAEGVAP